MISSIAIKKESLYLHTVKWFRVLPLNTNRYIYLQLKGFKYCCLKLIIQFNIDRLFTHSLIFRKSI